MTIESIAAEANLSAVTVYNYYGTKARLLLALVKESDDRLVAQLRKLIEQPPDDIREAVIQFGRIMRGHALRYLTKRTWREVIAASIRQGSGEFGQTYRALDRKLIEMMSELIATYQQRGRVAGDINPQKFADTLFEVQNIRFFQFIADDDLDDSVVDEIFRYDIEAIFSDKLTNNRSRDVRNEKAWV